MDDVRARDVVFTGFRFISIKPGVVVVWIALWILASFLSSVLLILLVGPEYAQFEAARASPATASPSGINVYFKAVAAYLVQIVGGAIVYSIFFAATARAVLEPDEDTAFYLRLGADESRQLGLVVLSWSLLAVIAIVLGLFVAALATWTLAALKELSMAAPMRGLSSTAVALAVGGGSLVYFGLRLSFASALTFDRRRLDLFGSWALTAGRFRVLFAIFCVVMGLMTAANLSALALVGLLTGAGGELSAYLHLDDGDTTSFQSYFTIRQMAAQLVTTIITGLSWPILFMPFVEYYRRLSGPSTADAF